MMDIGGKRGIGEEAIRVSPLVMMFWKLLYKRSYHSLYGDGEAEEKRKKANYRFKKSCEISSSTHVSCIRK